MAKYKLVMLAAMGLASLYMMHLLAMDYMKIQKIMSVAQRLSPAIASAARALLRGKRDLSSFRITNNTTISKFNTNFGLSKEEEEVLDNFKDNLKFNWDAILKMDFLKCSQSLICQITAGAVKNETIAENIGMVIKFKMCYTEYPLCVYSANTMIKILKWFINFMG
ncbi:uncharacterized protein LOC129614184, partial [Condylostylus longicornis]|uniref:uncharacterized protein LOC129614184 n=1 Tax=Condylostylus longicornis TaxID=2530218 RepID=UPI00244DCFAF